MDKTKEHKVFISYCWTTPQHEEWVYNLASRLIENGIDVKFDKWDLKPGHDKYAYMEKMVQDPSIDKVLIICDRGYKLKADNREGGVGTETQIITPEIYNKINQEKFIPIIAETGDEFDSFMPNYIKSRIGIDMSSDEVYEIGYDKLLRLCVEAPMYKKPAKGQLPSYIFEDEKPHYKTQNLVKHLKNCLLTKPEQVSYVIAEFIDEFKISLSEFQLSHEDMEDPFDELIYNQIKEMMPLRNDYVDFFSSVCRSKLDFNIDVIINLFEDIYEFTESHSASSYYDIQFDHFKFFIYEVLLYTVILLIENKMFEELDLLLSSRYFVKTKDIYKTDGIFFNDFRIPIESIEQWRKKRLNSNKISLTAELLIQRSVFNHENYKEQLIDADMLLFYISALKFEGEFFNYWFPKTSIYLREKKIDLLKRLVSKRHFEKVKVLFHVQTPEELKSILKSYKNPYKGYSTYPYELATIVHHINPDMICTTV